MGAGWYFALAEIGPDSAIILGLLYGIFLFPSFIQSRTQPVRMWIRISVVSCSVAIFLYWIASPFLPKKPVPDVSFDLMRVTSGEKAIVASADERGVISHEIVALKLRGDVHGGIRGFSGSGQSVPRIDVELIALEPITKEAQLAIPETGCALYVLRDGVWTAHPAILKKDRRTLTIEPGTDPHYDGGRLKLGKEPDFQSFTWYPVIPRGQ
jgi:hypothetical protein